MESLKERRILGWKDLGETVRIWERRFIASFGQDCLLPRLFEVRKGNEEEKKLSLGGNTAQNL